MNLNFYSNFLSKFNFVVVQDDDSLAIKNATTSTTAHPHLNDHEEEHFSKPSDHPDIINDKPIKLPTLEEGCGVSNVTHMRIVGGKPAKIGL